MTPAMIAAMNQNTYFMMFLFSFSNLKLIGISCTESAMSLRQAQPDSTSYAMPIWSMTWQVDCIWNKNWSLTSGATNLICTSSLASDVFHSMFLNDIMISKCCRIKHHILDHQFQNFRHWQEWSHPYVHRLSDLMHLLRPYQTHHHLMQRTMHQAIHFEGPTQQFVLLLLQELLSMRLALLAAQLMISKV